MGPCRSQGGLKATVPPTPPDAMKKKMKVIKAATQEIKTTSSYLYRNVSQLGLAIFSFQHVTVPRLCKQWQTKREEEGGRRNREAEEGRWWWKKGTGEGRKGREKEEK
ncbi:hypothetical protein PoB_003339700 [Plakobranchus ocellatus]|uniref:Uncharacterized protein n=1 Tax=Plakobranchus ocellatus TaxID=259542 RepID=A0AAV4AI20_9GAST|nr:hypothetical protein PoB_003339700 [Plakobranchus ocellatus]